MFAGENVVGGDKDSIKNLLEIFDGLLEYLKEEISEESQNGGRQFSFINLTDNYVFISNYCTQNGFILSQIGIIPF